MSLWLARRTLLRPSSTGGIVDSFDRADSASLGTTSDGNATWTDRGGSASVAAQIISNTAALPVSTSGDRISTVPGATAGAVQITATAVTSSNDSVAAIWRYQDNSNFFWALVGTSGALRFRVFKVVVGSVSQLYSGGGAVGDVIRVEFTTAGYTVKQNGSTVLTQSNTELNSATAVGLYLVGSGAATQPKANDFSFTP